MLHVSIVWTLWLSGTLLYIDKPQFICSTAGSHLGCIQFGDLIYKAAINICVRDSVDI